MNYDCSSQCFLKISKLTCNYLENPIGVDSPTPLLSWVLESTGRDQAQSAYQVLVAGSKEVLEASKGDLWDSGKVESHESIQIPYKGDLLQSQQGCYWKVRVWDKNDKVSDWSEDAYWEMGLLSEKDWTGKWITNTGGNPNSIEPPIAPLFRKEFNIEKNINSARAYICGLGYYELYINGGKVGDEVLRPSVTQYDKTALYQTYDITPAIDKGCNAIGVILGNGWYNCFAEVAWDFEKAPWRDRTKLLLQIHITFDDGSSEIIVSDRSWKWGNSPITYDGLRNGEHYDAPREKKGWDKPGFDDSNWDNAVITKSPGGTLRSQQLTPIRVTKTLKPVSVKEVRPGVWVFDIGQNISGWARLKVMGPVDTTITLKYAEKLDDSGDIDPSNIKPLVRTGDFQTDRYTLRGEEVEIWEPRFTYHGFQYIQVTGFPGKPDLDSIEARVVHTDLAERGSFSCSNDLLNSIQTNTKWSTLTNYHGIPTDCPHREKNGWTGDAQVSAEQTLLNFAPTTAYRKWIADFRDAQRPSGQLPGIVPTGGWGFNWGSGPAWDSAAILIPWYLYLYCGDKAILDENYDSMKRYIDFIESMAIDYIVDFGLGDWCPPGPPGNGPSDHKCPTTVTDTAYFYIDTHIVSKVAKILAKDNEAEIYSNLSNKVRQAFRTEFLDTETGQVTGNSQTSMACALYQGLINDDEKPKVLQALVDSVEATNRHIDCGILGTKYVMHTLTDFGRADLAYDIATQTTFPSWGHWIAQGATTLWESWQGEGSRNHHMFGDVSAWFYKGLGGINPDPNKPGFKHIIIRPNIVGDLTWVKASHQSMYGLVKSNWEVKNGQLNVGVSIPPNCTATLYLPNNNVKNLCESEKAVKNQPGINNITENEKHIVLELGSGTYDFKMDREVD